MVWSLVSKGSPSEVESREYANLFPGLVRVVIDRVSDCFDSLGRGVV